MAQAKIKDDNEALASSAHSGGILRNEVEVNERGQIVIPAKIRNLLGLEKNSRLRITLTAFIDFDLIAQNTAGMRG